MTILFADGEICALTPSDSSVFENLDPAIGIYENVFDPDFARASISVPYSAGGAYWETPSWSSTPDFWVRARAASGPYPAVLSLLSLYSGTTEVFRVRGLQSSMWMEYLSAVGTFTQIGETFEVSSYDGQDFDVNIKPATGHAAIYVAGTQRAADTIGAMSLFSGITKVRGRALFNTYWSNVICADEPTIGLFLTGLFPTGNGANTAWTGDYTGIDEPIFTDADGITSDVADQIETFTGAAPEVGGHAVRAVAICARAKRGVSGPQNLQLALRVDGANYFSATKALSVGYGGFCGVWETDPSTSAAWVTADAQGVEIGVKSIA